MWLICDKSVQNPNRFVVATLAEILVLQFFCGIRLDLRSDGVRWKKFRVGPIFESLLNGLAFALSLEVDTVLPPAV